MTVVHYLSHIASKELQVVESLQLIQCARWIEYPMITTKTILLKVKSERHYKVAQTFIPYTTNIARWSVATSSCTLQ